VEALVQLQKRCFGGLQTRLYEINVPCLLGLRHFWMLHRGGDFAICMACRFEQGAADSNTFEELTTRPLLCQLYEYSLNISHLILMHPHVFASCANPGSASSRYKILTAHMQAQLATATRRVEFPLLRESIAPSLLPVFIFDLPGGFFIVLVHLCGSLTQLFSASSSST
jgi:hypothetical protein